MPAFAGPRSLKIMTDHFPHLLELTLFSNTLRALDDNFQLYYNSLVQRGVNIAVNILTSAYYYNFADMAW